VRVPPTGESRAGAASGCVDHRQHNTNNTNPGNETGTVLAGWRSAGDTSRKRRNPSASRLETSLFVSLTDGVCATSGPRTGTLLPHPSPRTTEATWAPRSIMLWSAATAKISYQPENGFHPSISASKRKEVGGSNCVKVAFSPLGQPWADPASIPTFEPCLRAERHSRGAAHPPRGPSSSGAAPPLQTDVALAQDWRTPLRFRPEWGGGPVWAPTRAHLLRGRAPPSGANCARRRLQPHGPAPGASIPPRRNQPPGDKSTGKMQRSTTHSTPNRLGPTPGFNQRASSTARFPTLTWKSVPDSQSPTSVASRSGT